MRAKDSKEFEQLYNSELSDNPDISKKRAYHRAECKYFALNGKYKYKQLRGYDTFRVVISCRKRRAAMAAKAANELRRKK